MSHLTRKAIGVSAALFVMISLVGCGKIEPGHVGIVVDNWGSTRGVEDYPIKTGVVWYNPFTHDLYDFPVYTSTRVYTKNADEGSPTDESITFNSLEGAIVNADVSESFSLVDTKVPSIFIRFRQDLESLEKGYIRSRLRDAFSRAASQMSVVDIFGSKKSALEDSVLHILRAEFDTVGVRFEQISIVGALRVDSLVHESINRVIIAAQDAQQAQNRVAQARALADQMIETARGDSAAVVIRATGQAEGNRRLQASLNSSVLIMRWIEKWNGVPPYAVGSSSNLVTLPSMPSVGPVK